MSSCRATTAHAARRRAPDVPEVVVDVTVWPLDDRELAEEVPDRIARHALLADLLADHPDALDGLSAPELERLRGHDG